MAAVEEEGRLPWWYVAGARCELRFGYEGTREVDVAVDRDLLIPPESGWGSERWEVGGGKRSWVWGGWRIRGGACHVGGLERERWEVGVREFGAGGDDGAYTWVDWSESGDGGVGVGAPGAMARNVHTHEEAISLKCTS